MSDERFKAGDVLVLGHNEYEPHEAQGPILDEATAAIANAAYAVCRDEVDKAVEEITEVHALDGGAWRVHAGSRACTATSWTVAALGATNDNAAERTPDVD